MNLTDRSVDEWGIYQCFPINHFDYNDNWLVQKAYSLNAFPLKISIFERYPTMVREVPEHFAKTQYARAMNISGYGGVDGFLLGNIAQIMNFTVSVVHPADNLTYGIKKNGQFGGSTGDVLYHRADIAFNSRFLMNYGTNDIEFMVPILGDKVCVIMPSFRRTPQWKAIFNCFDRKFWITFFLITFGSSIVFSTLKYFLEKQERQIVRDSFLYKEYKHVVVEDKINVKDICIATWKVMIGMTAILPSRSVERLLIGSCLLANIIISGSFEVSVHCACALDAKKHKIYSN